MLVINDLLLWKLVVVRCDQGDVLCCLIENSAVWIIISVVIVSSGHKLPDWFTIDAPSNGHYIALVVYIHEIIVITYISTIIYLILFPQLLLITIQLPILLLIQKVSRIAVYVNVANFIIVVIILSNQLLFLQFLLLIIIHLYDQILTHIVFVIRLIYDTNLSRLSL